MASPGDRRSPPPVAPPTAEERRLDPRSILVQPLQQVGGLLPVVAVYLVLRRADLNVVELVTAVVVAVPMLGASAVRWLRFRYRIVNDRLEVREGLLALRHRVMPLDRIRGVDIKAGLAHRLVGVAAVEIDAAETGGTQAAVSLDAVSWTEARSLRGELLRRRGAALDTGTDAGPAGDAATDASAVTTLLRMPARWLLYAPCFGSLLAAGPAAAGALFSVAAQAGLLPDDEEGVTVVVENSWSADWWWLGPLVVLVAIVASVLAAIIAAALRFYGWTVEDHGGDLTIERGLITRRTVGLERVRLRGFSLAEPLLGRPLRVGRLTAVLSGLDGDDRSTLVPLAPQADARRLAAALLPDAVPPIIGASDDRTIAHPRAALRRRLIRTVAPAGAALIATTVWPSPWLAGGTVLLAGLGAAYAFDLSRALRHGLDDQRLAVRRGSLVRRTDAVRRLPPIGFTLRQTFFQRRAGLATVDVAMAAGKPIRVADLDAAGAADLAARLLPTIVEPLRTRS
ncbi:MAG: PH domain-containing protein [Acidimicrobiales bacterium]